MASPPSKPQTLLPDDLILEIFSRADVNTVGCSRTLCSYWSWEIETEEFVFKHLHVAKKRPASIYIHFGIKGRRSLRKWVSRFNVDIGENERLRIPFLRNSQGQFEVISTDNGCMAIRYSCISHPSNLIVLNLNTDQVTQIPNPTQHHCCICTSTYAILYFPDSVGYVWINIYKKKIFDSQSWLTSYSSMTSRWVSSFSCPPYVQGLDSRYVVNHGIVYWLNWNNHAQISPQCIVHFSIFTNKFGFILILVEARAMIQRLLICEGGSSGKLKKAIKATLGICRLIFGLKILLNQLEELSSPSPNLPMEIMLKIFYLCDVSTILNTQATCRFWRKNLSSYAFLEEIARRCKSKSCSLFAHFGYSFDWTKSLDWVMNMSALTGETSPLYFPFLLTTKGWFQIVGVENGIVCIRYSSIGNKRYLLTWNPISRYSKIISNPNKYYCEEETGMLEFHAQRMHIVSFNIITYSFDQISLPEEGLQRSHTLLVRSGHLCVAANIGDDYSYNSVIWQLNQNSSIFNWTKLFSYSGIGPSYIPSIIVDDDIIQIKERHLEIMTM
ncbi:hypothetical protein Ahy_B06g083108 isoform A [Arachis hypogaea]|uniref:F-box domain-containing protein n=1 Tax=Arachis hypogaea TaxID=3818 RepID=A0A444YPA7_ARAHY|nr:hypothetical protein Ahy_B06g083108 isoform A [Arachis hypogaea]